jgi:large subunit ribosomal protein L9
MARTLKLMLVKQVEGLGDLGEVVRVRPGYARNYLVPRGLAAPVSDDALKQVAAERKRFAVQAQKAVENAKATQELLRSKSLHIEAKAGEGGHLYGSVSAQMIAEALAKQGINIDPTAVNLENPIKELGIYTVTLKLHSDVTGIIKVYVVMPPPEKGEKSAGKAEAGKAEKPAAAAKAAVAAKAEQVAAAGKAEPKLPTREKDQKPGKGKPGKK